MAEVGAPVHPGHLKPTHRAVRVPSTILVVGGTSKEDVLSANSFSSLLPGDSTISDWGDAGLARVQRLGIGGSVVGCVRDDVLRDCTRCCAKEQGKEKAVWTEIDGREKECCPGSDPDEVSVVAAHLSAMEVVCSHRMRSCA